MVGNNFAGQTVLYAKVHFMPKDYVRIACMVGANLRSELRRTAQEPLPEPMRELLRKFDEQESATDSHRGRAPVKKLSRKHRGKGASTKV
jgi:hypothetical protein